jgi:hypothetical protein
MDRKINFKYKRREVTMMNKRDERMKVLANAGIETGKYFTFELPEGLEPGAEIKIAIIDGKPQVVNKAKENPVYNEIIEDGYVRNTKLHRRWVMAQMFRMLGYERIDIHGKVTHEGYNDALKRYGYDYTFEMMLEEVRVLGKLEVRDWESFQERSHFFTKDVVVAVCDDYMNKLKAHIGKMKVKKCKGVPYVRVKGNNIFVEDLNKKIYQPLQYRINRIKFADDYTEMYQALQRFMREMVRLPWDTVKSKEWIDAYKGNGAYYTCKNMIMFHDCKVKDLDRQGFLIREHNRDDSMAILEEKLDEYQGEGWRMFAFMKKLIADNNFDFKARMHEIYNK